MHKPTKNSFKGNFSKKFKPKMNIRLLRDKGEVFLASNALLSSNFQTKPRSSPDKSKPRHSFNTRLNKQ